MTCGLRSLSDLAVLTNTYKNSSGVIDTGGISF